MEQNILKLVEEREDKNNLYEFDDELYDKKVQEYKNKIDNGDFEFEDTILNLGLVARRLMNDKEEKYRIAGEVIYNQMYGNLEQKIRRDY